MVEIGSAVENIRTQINRPETKRTFTVAVLLSLVAYGAVLRFTHLNVDTFKYDEARTAQIIKPPPSEAVKDIEFILYPVSMLLARTSVVHFGFTEGTMRIYSAVGGTLAIAAVFLLGRHLGGGRRGCVHGPLLAADRSCPHGSILRSDLPLRHALDLDI